MNAQEWESLCDGCGLCCLIRFEDEDTGEIIPTRVSCQLLDQKTCLCKDYANRQAYVPDCIKLDLQNIEAMTWLPRSCAYRRLNEGKTLPAWHPLLTGDSESVHEAGVSVRDQTVSETVLENPEDALDFTAYDFMSDRSDG
jgi:uncharacterized cysteine cluster protein YcgN (CxxCxxCC family)